MKVTRREFIQGGVSAFTIGFAAPAFLSELAIAQGASRRNLVVLYLAGGNDALSTLVPYTDNFYFSRRPTIRVPAGDVIQIGTDAAGRPLGLHPRLTGLRQIYDAGNLAIVQRSGYPNSSRSHFSAPTSGPRPIRRARWDPAGSAGISIRCRRPSIRSSAGVRPGRCRIRSLAGK